MDDIDEAASVLAGAGDAATSAHNILVDAPASIRPAPASDRQPDPGVDLPPLILPASARLPNGRPSVPCPPGHTPHAVIVWHEPGKVDPRLILAPQTDALRPAVVARLDNGGEAFV